MRCFNMQWTKPDREGNRKCFPCGNCEACRKRDATAWGIRSYFEGLGYDESLFIGLTYDEEHLPKSKCPIIQGNLDKSHIQKFKKLLAYYCGSFRSICGGEYGDETYRSHYHLILYGIGLDNPVFTDKFYVPSKKAWIAKCKAWPYGEVCIRPVVLADYFYVSKYSLKGDKRKFDDLAKKYGVQRPFRLCSQGLGLQYLLKEKERIMHDGFIRFKGSKIHIPRYFFDKLYPMDTIEREDAVFRKSCRAYEVNKDFWHPYLDKYGTVYSASKALAKQQEYNFKKGK